MKLAKRELYILLVFILLLIGFGYYQYLWTPLQKQMAVLASGNQALQGKISQTDQTRKQQEKVIADQSQVEKDIAGLRQLLPAGHGIPDLIKYAEDKASASGCPLQRVLYGKSGSSNQSGLTPDELSLLQIPTVEKKTDQKTETVKGVKSVQIEFETIGDYYALRRFILAMESSPRLLSFDKLQISTIEERNIMVNEAGETIPAVPAGDNLRLNLTVTVYYDEELAATGSAPEPITKRNTNPFRK